MQGDSLSPQHPLILTYYCISMTGLTDKCVECGIVQLAVQHLKKLEMFMTLTGVSVFFFAFVFSFPFRFIANFLFQGHFDISKVTDKCSVDVL